MPLDDQALVLEPRYPMADVLMSIGQAARERTEEERLPEGVTFRNSFWSKRHRTRIVIWEEDGKICWGPLRPANSVSFFIHTLNSSHAWGVEQEARAIQTLAGMIPHHKFKAYLLTGTVLEISRRSGVAYLVRKLRPTVALTLNEDRPRVLCALCQHPIGYYDETWAGVMCPTDEVVAHLMMIRGDEPMFWKRSNQHPPDRPEAGI